MIKKYVLLILVFYYINPISGINAANVSQTVSSNKGYVVTGKVVDNYGEPLPGVIVTVKNTKEATSTDEQGTYKITVPEGGTQKLYFSFLGMSPQEKIVKGAGTLDILMSQEDIALQDVEITGAYGTIQKRSDIVSSAYQVTSKQFTDLPTGRIDKLLEGMVPGLTINPNTDLASSTRERMNVRIRGEGSMSASKEPLWVVDGIPMYTGSITNQVLGANYSISPLSFINPEDVESMTILKDASATAIYGANGSNGVILVTTKSGKAGKNSVSLSVKYGISHINQSTLFKTLNAAQYMELAQESWVNAGRSLSTFPYQDNSMNSYSTTDTNWKDEYYDIGNSLDVRFSASGGGKKATYYVSSSYYRQEQTVKGNTSNRATFMSKNEFKLTDWLTFNFKGELSYNINYLFVPGDYYYQTLPIFSPYNPDGSYRLYNYILDGYDSNGNPIWTRKGFINTVQERYENDNRQRALKADFNASVTAKIISGLQYTGQFGAGYNTLYEDMYDARSNWGGMDLQGQPVGYSSRSNGNSLAWTTIHRLNYQKIFAEKHNVNAVAGFEMNSSDSYSVSSSGEGFSNDHIKEVSYASTRRGSSSQSTNRSMSYFLQAGYSYDSRYYIVLNGRRDGASQFGTDVRWKNFGSVGVSWNIHNEPFYRESVMPTIVDIIKLKASFGSTGNSRLGSVESQGTYSYSTSDMYISSPGASLSNTPNPDLGWETTYKTNVGLRTRFFNRLDIEIEWYNDKTVDLISKMDVSRTTGGTRVYRNVGEIRNRGIEVTITSENIKMGGDKGFLWVTDLNMSHNNNKILKLYNGIEKTHGDSQIWMEGADADTYYLVRWAGVDPRDGHPLWYDANGNITRTYSADDRVPYKSAAPKLTGGMTNTFSYKGVSLRVFFTYVIGGYTFGNFSRRTTSDGKNITDNTGNQSVNMLDRWQNPGDLALNPMPSFNNSTQSVMNSTRYLYNRTNIVLKNISLSYSLPEKILKKIKVSNFRLAFIVDNIAIWTPYDHDNWNSYKQAMSGYPMETTYSFSLDMSF